MLTALARHWKGTFTRLISSVENNFFKRPINSSPDGAQIVFGREHKVGKVFYASMVQKNVSCEFVESQPLKEVLKKVPSKSVEPLSGLSVANAIFAFWVTSIL